LGLTENLKNMASSMQQTAKNTTVTFVQQILRLVSGFFIGLVLAIIIQELLQGKLLMLVFLTILFMMIVFKLLVRLQIMHILIFDLICVLIATLLRMYIMIAPK
jgi:F0F1-type ATP synthase assembly protein I